MPQRDIKESGDAQSVEDTYFLDPLDAMAVALQGNMVEQDGIRRLQLCYFDGPDFDVGPANLINVPLAKFSAVYTDSMLPLPTRIQPARGLDETSTRNVIEAFDEMIDDLSTFRAENPTGDYRFGRDTYFFSHKDAYREAIQRKFVDLGHPTVFGLQVCYYDGNEVCDAPPNMVHLPAERVAEELVDARTRLPTAVRVAEDTPEEVRHELVRVFQELMTQTLDDKKQRFTERCRRARQLAPQGDPKSLRVLLATTRTTQVLQYATFGLARAFESLGHAVHVAIERNPMEQMVEYYLVREYLDFAPDVFIIINHLRNQWIHPDVTHVAWYQDLMPALSSGEALAVRENDQIYSATVELDDHLRACGIDDFERQSFCVDAAVFHPPEIDHRRQRIVFVGSAYARQVADGPRTEEMKRYLLPRVENGKVYSRTEIEELAERMNVSREQAFWNLYHYLTRDVIVHWMCQRLPALGLEVEVYGRYWDRDPLVAPFFCGEVEHGDALGDLYRDSRFALVCHPFDLNSQRLAEVAACGCIPVVYDCRRVAELPHWDDECLFFKTPDELVRLFESEPTCDPAPIAERNSYMHFARRILRRHRRESA